MAFKPKNAQERTLHRLKIAKGHLLKVMKMVEDNEYCIDVLHQLQAIQEGLKSTGNLVLENHLKTCTSDAIKKGESKKAIAEIMQILEKKNI